MTNLQIIVSYENCLKPSLCEEHLKKLCGIPKYVNLVCLKDIFSFMIRKEKKNQNKVYKFFCDWHELIIVIVSQQCFTVGEACPASRAGRGPPSTPPCGSFPTSKRSRIGYQVSPGAESNLRNKFRFLFFFI